MAVGADPWGEGKITVKIKVETLELQLENPLPVFAYHRYRTNRKFPNR